MSNTIDPSLLLSNYQQKQKKAGSNILGKDDFLKLLMTQLQNQDPSNPMEDREFIAQMAQFSTLEQMTNLNSSMDKFISAQEQSTLISYNQFIGKEITWHNIVEAEDPEEEPIIEEGTGIVSSIQFKDGSVQLILEDGTELSPGNVSGINNSPSSENGNNLFQASMLIGKMVTFSTDTEEEMKAMVQSVSFKNGKTLFQLNDEEQTRITSSQIIKIE